MTDQTLSPALAAVVAERAAQNAQWGVQRHPNGTGPSAYVFGSLADAPGHYAAAVLQRLPAERLAAIAKAATDRNAADGAVTWFDILLEEVLEAAAESNPARLRAELVQVAAVAIQWIETLDNAARPRPTARPLAYVPTKDA